MSGATRPVRAVSGARVTPLSAPPTAAPSIAIELRLSADTLDTLSRFIRDQIVAELGTAPTTGPSLLTIQETCRRYKITAPTLSRMRREGMPHVLIGDAPRFDPGKCDEWLEARARRESTSTT